jgi:hypothetical protein
MALLRLTAISFVVGMVLPAAPQATDEQVLRVPSMPEWQLVHKMDPEYPPAALQHRIPGHRPVQRPHREGGRIEVLT